MFKCGLLPDKTDERDYLYKQQDFLELPKKLTLEMPKIRNQGNIGSCASFSITTILSHFYSLSREFSPLFVYYNARMEEFGTAEKDTGNTLRGVLKSINKTGFCTEHFWEYDTKKYTEEPTKSAYLDGKETLTGDKILYQRVFTANEIKNGMNKGYLPYFGFKMYENLFAEFNGFIPYPSGKMLGGHAVVISGYDDIEGHFIIHNSWGERNGDDGYYYMPYEVFEKLKMDCWLINIIPDRVEKETNENEDKKIMQKKGIDVSHHNDNVNLNYDNIDWKKVKNDGIDFAIIRTGFGREMANQVDKQFENYYAKATAVGLPLGVYHYSYATNPAMAIEEANFCLKLIKGKKFEYPIYFDIEENRQKQLSKEVCTAIVKAFCDTIEKAGYWAGVYSYDSFFSSNLDEYIQKRYACWVARVENVKPTYCKTYQMHQYSWKGNVNGMVGDVDLNYCYADYPSVIKKYNKNGFGDETKNYNISATKYNLTENEVTELGNLLKSQEMTVYTTEV